MTATFDGTSAAALSLRNVVKRFGDFNAVNGLSFDVSPGQLLCLLGPNGAGKTTTIQMCEGFLKPTTGEISVLGLNPATDPDAVRARIGIMLQGGGGYSGIRVKEMLDLAAKYNANPHDPDWLLEVLGLTGARRTTYRRLSGGQKQRLALALAVIGRPQLVFLDEPTAGMDAQSRLVVWELIRALKRDKVTVVLTTHLMDEAEALADRVVIVDHGQAVAEGSLDELLHSDTAAHLELDVNADIDAHSFAQATGVKLEPIRPLRYSITAEMTPQLVAAITAELARQDVLVRRLDSTNRNLEDVFLDITGRHLRS